jgi:hypothetical protein
VKRRVWLAIAVTATAGALSLFGWYLARYLQRSVLPYHDSFAQNDGQEWTPIGGNWEIRDGSVVNRSDEHGAKLVTGSDAWRNYELETDLQLIGHAGDVGVTVRVRDEEPGVDSYNGYYVGLRSPDSAIVIGRADHGWLEGRPQPMDGGVQTGVWYRLRVVVVDCAIGAEATNLTTGQQSSAAFEENPCVPSGKIGLRSMATGGAWRNISVRSATYPQYQAIRDRASIVQAPVYPIREDAYDHMRESLLGSTFSPANGYREATAGASLQSTTSIGSAKATGQGDRVRLRGVITLTSPLYVQDATAGIGVHLERSSPLNVGDEVELSGIVEANGTSRLFSADEVRLLADRSLVAPASITSTQAASGVFDGRLVEVRGALQSKHSDGDEVTLILGDSEQIFRVVGQRGLSRKPFDSWEPGSELRVRGVCIVGPWRQPDGGAFTLLIKSANDVDVLSGPPWWSPRLIARYVLLLFLLIAICVYLYLHVERSKMRAILNERERLAHEMHDTLAQSFAGVGFHLQGVRNSLRSGAISMAAVLEKLDVACGIVTHTHRQASAEIAALHPNVDDGSDVLTALERSTYSMLEEIAPLKLLREGTPRKLSLTARDVLFQIGREAIANVLRHSHATEITLLLHYGAKEVSLSVYDNGVGFVLQEHEEDFGIRAMRRRSQKAGAIFQIQTAPGQGTCVCVTVPYGSHSRMSRPTKPLVRTNPAPGERAPGELLRR